MRPDIIITSEEVKDFIKANCTKLDTGTSIYYFLPYWFKFKPDTNIVHVFSLQEKLPDDLKCAIEDNRINFK